MLVWWEILVLGNSGIVNDLTSWVHRVVPGLVPAKVWNVPNHGDESRCTDEPVTTVRAPNSCQTARHVWVDITGCPSSATSASCSNVEIHAGRTETCPPTADN